MSISRAPQNGGSGIGTSVRAVERTEASVTGGPSSTFTTCLRSVCASSRILVDQRAARLGVDQLVDRPQPGEGVLAVEDARLVDLVGLLAVRVEDAPAEVAVDRGAADQHGELEPALVQLLDARRHLLRGRHEQRGQPDRVGVVLDRGVDDRVDRDLLAEVDHRVAVVGEDRVDERLADVVHVAEHGRDHDLALRVALDPLEVVLELRHGALHHLGRLEHERQDQLAGAELVAHLLHGRQQHLVERRDRADLLDRAVDPVLHALLLAAQDVEVERLLGLHALGRVGPPSSSSVSPFCSKWPMKRSSASSRLIEDEVVGQLALVLGDLVVGRDVVGVDHREVEPRLHAVVEEDRVEHRARARRDAERDVRDAQRGLDAGQLGLDPPDAVDRLDGGGLHSSSPVVSVNVSASKISASRSSPCSSQASSTIRLAISTLRSAVLAMPTSSIVSAISGGAVRLGERRDHVELVAARPRG